MINATLNPNGSRCCVCRAAQRSVIVPPTYYKDMSNPYLQRVYELTEQELLSAKEIIFCGYSFPDADMHIKYLLKRSEQNSNRNEPLKIKIINHGNNPEEKTDILDSSEIKQMYIILKMLLLKILQITRINSLMQFDEWPLISLNFSPLTIMAALPLIYPMPGSP